MSLISKIFGGKKQQAAAIVPHKNYVEALQIDILNNDFRISGFNKSDIMSFYENMKNEEMTESIRSLFSEALPKPIKADRLIISIPSKYVFPFIKIFPSHSNEDYMRSSLMEIVQNEAPFGIDDLIIDFEHNESVQNKIAGAIAYPKEWSNKIINSIYELGIGNLDFVPEPLSFYSLTGLNNESCAIISYDSGILNISLFYKGILFDTFDTASKSAEDINYELEKENNNFESNFGETINKIYSLGLPLSLDDKLRKTINKGYSYTIVLNPFSSLADKGSSFALSGLVKRLF